MVNPFKNVRAWKADYILDESFKNASKEIEHKVFEGDMVDRAMQKEGVRIKVAGNMAVAQINSSIDSFPNIDNLPPIYQGLVDVLIGKTALKRSLSFMQWTSKMIEDFKMKYLNKLQFTKNTKFARDVRKEFYGRVASLLRKAEKDTELLYYAVGLLKRFPDIEDVPTVIITGFPNVGKSSVLHNLTGSKPKIMPYPFTTKSLMLGFSEYGFKKVQFIDTPGLFDRPAAKRNSIELQGEIAMKLIADIIIYVFDISEICGYSLERQKNLLREIRETFRKPVIVLANKTDVVGGRDPSEVGGIPVSSKTGEGFDKVKDKLTEILKNVKR